MAPAAVGEALALAETDLDRRRGAVLIRHGKGDKRREVGMDSWAWELLEPCSAISARSRTPSAPAPAVRITAMISSTVGGSAG
ncbi:MAG: hypothetical protein ACLP0J_00240 [Solirubrobacteraceae bacterium]